MNMFHFENMNIRLIIKEQGRSMPDCRVPVLSFAAVYTEKLLIEGSVSISDENKKFIKN